MLSGRLVKHQLSSLLHQVWASVGVHPSQAILSVHSDSAVVAVLLASSSQLPASEELKTKATGKWTSSINSHSPHRINLATTSSEMTSLCISRRILTLDHN